MTSPDTLRETPAPQASWEVAGRQLREVQRARRRLAQRADPAALHDFRVALRRLRTMLRALRHSLGLPKGLRRQARRLARASNESRNLETWEGWIGEQWESLSATQQIGVSWLRARLTDRRLEAEDAMRRRLAKGFPRLAHDLKAALAVPVTARREARARAAIGRAIASDVAELEQQLAVVHSMADREAAHTARIAAKRVRYLLEAFAAGIPGTAPLLQQLKGLQTTLGEVHDAHVFADELRDAIEEASQGRARKAGAEVLPWPSAKRVGGETPPPEARRGLLALARRLKRSGDARFERLRTDWLEGPAAGLSAGLRALPGRPGVPLGGVRGGPVPWHREPATPVSAEHTAAGGTEKPGARRWLTGVEAD